MTTNADRRTDFYSLLAASTPSPEIPESAGMRADGTKTRWTFTEITEDAFHWRGEALYANKSTWTLEAEFLARRR
jgi:hypothetical protein